MAVIRANFFFKIGENGWTETFYSTKPTLEGALADAWIAGRKLRDMKASDCEWFAYRVSDDEVKGDSLLESVPMAARFNQRAGLGTMNAAWDAAEIRLEAGTMKRRVYAARGLEDNCFQGGAFLYTGNLAAKYPAFQAEMISGKWGIRAQSTLAPRIIISQFAAGPGTTLLVLTTATPHNLETNDMAYVGGPDRTGLLRGFYRVIKVDANTLWIRSAAVINLLVGLFYIRKVTYAVVPFDKCSDVLRAGKRDTGRPSFGPRGRRSARRLR